FVGGFRPEVFQAAARLVVSPGVSLQEPVIQAARQRGAEILGDIELFARVAKAPVVAITGSNGKSTVTSLLGEMAKGAGRKVAVGGNLGSPALDLLRDDIELYVLELSSFQLESTDSLHASAAVVLNISADHMDRYRDLDHYAATKAVIYRHAGIAVINRDDPRAAACAVGVGAEIGFTLGSPEGDDFGICENQEAGWLCQGPAPLIPVSELRIPGRHNQANALAALALGSAVDLPMSAMLQALRIFPGLPHRTQFVAERRHLRWYNDSKGTNVGATVAALQGLHPEIGESRTILIAGGDCKGADFSGLASVVEQTARAVILIGRDAPLIAAALQDRVQLVFAKTLSDAVQQALNLGRPGDRVLLSPACASFDMFRNFEARGQAFMNAVEALAA
ncbi:MAG: UDP-N-acetylmuramoyl-L-alanine--D-glutamate ligase, partial [Gammaproteobacteria bacterium]|nr:UDP-N-acetylmuramoyl-L-alanine--D-glutamate ligase [Gammaproteobacteria bacterium]